MVRILVFFLVIIFSIAGGVSDSIADENYPNKRIELFCPYGAGGSTSMGTRIIAGTLSEVIGEPVVVINKTGAGGSIAAEHVAKAKPDGYTLFVFNSGSNGVTPVIRTVRYKNDDFTLFGQYATQMMGLIVGKDAPFNNFAELVKYAKQNPGKLKYGTSGVGTSAHFGMELIKIFGGDLKIDHVPFKSGPEFFAALLGNHVQMGFWYQVGFKPQVEAGRVKLLAMATETRSKVFPDVPTFTELGYPEIQMSAWYGVAGPKGLPSDVQAKLNGALSKTMQHPEVQKMLSKIGYAPTYKNAEDFAKMVKEAEEKYRMVAEKAGIEIK
jgi:tripartite-type tricarboxylate transporter receptor subunit TctC